MGFSFSIDGKPQSIRLKKLSAASDDSPAIEFVTEFRSDEAPPSESLIKAIAPIPNVRRPKKKLKSNRLKKPPAADAAAADSPAIECVTGFRPDEAPPSESQIKAIAPIPNVRRPKKKLKNLPNLHQLFKSNGEHAGLQFELDAGSNPEPSGYGLTLRQPSANRSDVPDGKSGTISYLELRKLRDDLTNPPEGPWLDEYEDVPVEGFGAALLSKYGCKEDRGFGRNAKEDVTVAKDTRKRGREGRVRNDTHKDKKERRNVASKSGHERVEAKRERVDWLRNHIRVRIISQELKQGRLYLKKGVVVDVVGPGVCDVYIDETRDFVQGVDQDFLEAALPKDGGPVLVLCGKHKGVYGNLLKRDSEKEAGVVRDADSHELLGVKLEQVAEYTGALLV